MGASTSSTYTKVDAHGGGNGADIFASPREKAAFEKLMGRTPVPREDSAYQVVFTVPKPLTHLSQTQVEYLNHEYGATIAQNSLESGNFRVLLRYVIHSLPFCCRIDRMSHEEFEAQAPGAATALDPINGKKRTIESHISQAVNALFLVRNFTMRFVEKQDECPLLAHFNRQVPDDDWNTIVSPRAKKENAPPKDTRVSYDDLAFRFLDALLTVLIDFPPTPRTYDLHVEVVSTLLVLLSPVAFPRDHTKHADDVSAHNPFLHMLMSSALSQDGKKAYWAPGIVHRLLQNYIDQIQSPPASKDAGSVLIALENATKTSLIKISEATDLADEAEHFSYLTLEGIGSLATSIFRFPLSFYHYFVANDAHASPLTDRSVFLLLVLLQSYRDDEAVSNPFREALCSIANSEATDDENAVVQTMKQPKETESRTMSATKPLELPYSKLFAAIGRNAPYESSHLLLYTMMYTNTMMHDTTVSHCDVNHLMLPLLETLYHSRSVEPSRIYMLVIVLLTYTQDAAFVREAHTRTMVHTVPWYSERYILDVSLGSLMMVIFTRLIFRNITHFQDSFIHLNAFAALSNLARYAENVHVYAAQGIVGLIEMLAKKEMQLVAKMEQQPQQQGASDTSSSEIDIDDPEVEKETLVQKRSAYVEFIRLLLGVVSSCLKAKLLPRNPQLIYSLLYRAETFAALQCHPEFTHQVYNGPVWNTLARFRAIVDSKTTPEDVLDVDTVLAIIRAECVSLLAASSSSGMASSSAAAKNRRGASLDDDEDASYRYEEEAYPEQFFVPYVWKLIFEQTPDFCWKVDKITLFAPSSK
uniref:Dymeclin n=1 Tax=Globisporangium ultimum (strain ATCC 200006 / CBS 805.95 / DAOM BR144) TaxID=431595 RepID=K3WTM7_GLOUD